MEKPTPFFTISSLSNKQEKSQKPKRRILHIDMDAFFAQIEQRDNPFLKGKPVVIGGPPGSRGVASTCSYEARKFGVHSAMPIQQVQKICPHAVYMPINGRKYSHVSKQIMLILQKFSPKIEPISIDEAFINIMGLDRIYKSEKALGHEIKKAIYAEQQLTCTIGIAPTKILAKLASGLNKPDGLNIIEENKIDQKVYPLPVRELWGIGEATEKSFKKLGIKTIGDLANYSEVKMKKIFGKNGPMMVRAAAGKLDSPVHCLEEIPLEKSVGHEHTFWSDTNDYEHIRAQFLLLVQRVGRRMRKKDLRGRTITIKLRYENFETHTHRKSLTCYTNNENEIFTVAEELFQQIYENGRNVRLVGVSLSNFIQKDIPRLGLPFKDEMRRIKTDQNLTPAVDKIKDEFGENSVWRASSLTVFKKL
jgi:DNA polymerase IV